jgi:hypothetical protein
MRGAYIYELHCEVRIMKQFLLFTLIYTYIHACMYLNIQSFRFQLNIICIFSYLWKYYTCNMHMILAYQAT